MFSEFAKVFDPMGLVMPVLLGGKILMKEAWGKEVKFGWDEALPQDQVAKWCQFLEDLFGLELLRFDRSLMPLEEVVGKPERVGRAREPVLFSAAMGGDYDDFV